MFDRTLPNPLLRGCKRVNFRVGFKYAHRNGAKIVEAVHDDRLLPDHITDAWDQIVSGVIPKLYPGKAERKYLFDHRRAVSMARSVPACCQCKVQESVAP